MRVLLARDSIVLGQLADVRPCDKRLFARARKNHYADRRVVLDVMECRAQFLHAGHIERIEHLRAVDGDVSDCVLLLKQNVFVGHKSISSANELGPQCQSQLKFPKFKLIVILTLSKAEGEGSAFLEGKKKPGPSPSALLRVRMTDLRWSRHSKRTS